MLNSADPVSCVPFRGQLGVIKLKVGEESFNGRSAAFKPQQAPNFAQAAKPQSVE
jgi:hypothetical protein